MAKTRSPRNSREPRRFLRAAEERLKEARFLLDNQFTTASVYLAGYAVECLLKALILWHEPARRHRETLQSFRGAKAHDYDWLRGQLQRRNISVAPIVAGQLIDINWWSTDLRYDPSDLHERTAKNFLAITGELFAWAKGKL